jgi:hypothetical protein
MAAGRGRLVRLEHLFAHVLWDANELAAVFQSQQTDRSALSYFRSRRLIALNHEGTLR